MAETSSQRRATIKDVAAASGVSAQTVSRVINQHPSVAPETRRRIEESIERLKYTPSALARSLQSNRSRTVGVLLAGMQHTGPAQTLTGIMSECALRDHTVLIAELRDLDDVRPEPAISSLLEHRVDGIIVSVPQVGPAVERIAAVLDELTVPAVFVRADGFEDYSGVVVDNADAINQVVDHLVEQGRRTIAHIGGADRWQEARARSAAWSERLAHHGIEARYLESGDWTARSGAVAMAKLLDCCPTIDAVVAGNDHMALGALYLLDKRGRTVPSDVAVTGFDDIPEAAWSVPSLTSVAQPLQAMGRAAVEVLLSGQDQPSNHRAVEALTCQLIVRESTAGPTAASWPLPSD